MSLFNRYTNIFYSTDQETNNETNNELKEDQNKQTEIETEEIISQETQTEEILSQETQTEETQTDNGIGLGLEPVRIEPVRLEPVVLQSVQTFKTFLSQILEPSFNYIDSTELYVIAVDGVPKFYVKDEATASKKMWEVIRVLSHNNYFDYFTNFVQISKDELHLLGCFKMFVISYDRLLHTVTYKKVKQCI